MNRRNDYFGRVLQLEQLHFGGWPLVRERLEALADPHSGFADRALWELFVRLRDGCAACGSLKRLVDDEEVPGLELCESCISHRVEARRRAVAAPWIERANAEDERKRERRAREVVYFAWRERRSIKIGTTCDLSRPERLGLEVVATIKGGVEVEREMHRRFAHLRLPSLGIDGGTEHFRPAPELLEFVSIIREKQAERAGGPASGALARLAT